jgi:hypothetical protein
MELGSNEAKAAQGPGTGTELRQRRRRELEICPNDNFLHLSPSAQEDSQRTPDVQGKLAHGLGQLN